MHLDQIKPALKTLIGTLTGLVTVWENEPQPFIPPGPQALVRLSLGPIVGIGSDEAIQVELGTPEDPPAPGEELTNEIRGNRRFTLTIRVEAQIQTDTGDAASYLEKVREGLWFRDTSEALHSVNCAWVDVLATVKLDEPRDQRAWSIAALDVVLAHRLAYQDPARWGWIESVDLAGSVVRTLRP